MKQILQNEIINARNNMFDTEATDAVAIASKSHGIRKFDVGFVDGEFLKGKTITSMYLPDHDLILFNKDLLSVAKLDEVILTEFHETRHANQQAQIDWNPNFIQNESPETITNWKLEFDKYYRPSDEFLDDPLFLEQEIEKKLVVFHNKRLHFFGFRYRFFFEIYMLDLNIQKIYLEDY